jgi:acyl carrier protein
MIMSTRLDVRSFIADRIGVAVEEVTDEVHFADDLKFDRFDRLELAIQIEDKFGVEFSQEAVERMQEVGDLIRYVESDLSRDRPVLVPPEIAPRGRQW